MLTYESIRKILDEEKATGRLTVIPDDFFTEALNYLDKKAKVADEEWKLESARRRLQDIIDIREKKIINSAINAVKANVTLDNLTAEEMELFNNLVSVIKAFRQKVEKQMDIKEKEEFVAIFQDIEEFVGTNLKKYGPFKSGDMATVPKPVADFLVKKGAAERIEGNPKPQLA